MDNYKKKYEEAKMFAVRNHGLQEYDGFPYHKHLQDVVDVIVEFGYHGKYIIAAWLHDILEDCPVSYNDIKKNFGEEVAEIVYCVTDELGRNRKERKGKTYPKIRSNPDAIIIKLADRIANLQNCLDKNHGMLNAYVKEHDGFKFQLQVPNHAIELWDHLETLIKQVEEKNFKKA